MSKGLPGRLSRGAGTHLASWLQEVDRVVGVEARADAEAWLIRKKGMDEDEKLQAALGKLRALHGRSVGHSQPIVDVALSGEILITKDPKSMRLWRARDGTLLRVVSCSGNRVAFSASGQNIVSGLVNRDGNVSAFKLWGPGGQSAVGCGKTRITVGKSE